MNKRLWIAVALVAAALVGTVVFLVREGKETDGPARVGTSSRNTNKKIATRSPERPAKTSADSDDDGDGGSDGQHRVPGRLRKSGSPIPEDGVIKTTADGREYVEYTREDGTRVRDFRSSAKKKMTRRRGPRGPRLLAPQNAAMVKRDARPKVWACMREHWDAITQLPGVNADDPAVIVFAKTSADSGTARVGAIEVVVEGAEHGDPGLARCIEGALAGLEVGLVGGVDQKAYEDFELGLRFRLPKNVRKQVAP